ncbi:hypothetical protein [Micromonospora pattaloongensis]|uniref:hypothetical protein n=1 Tax=Micromonospora pattaloongensis TaxID=405436 RepID=UPI001115138E|nr:hypothetical protein [Micromonospora pattaloongensis]
MTTADDLATLFVLNASAVNALPVTANATASAAIAGSGVRGPLVRAYISCTAYADDQLISTEVEGGEGASQLEHAISAMWSGE